MSVWALFWVAVRVARVSTGLRFVTCRLPATRCGPGLVLGPFWGLQALALSVTNLWSWSQRRPRLCFGSPGSLAAQAFLVSFSVGRVSGHLSEPGPFLRPPESESARPTSQVFWTQRDFSLSLTSARPSHWQPWQPSLWWLRPWLPGLKVVSVHWSHSKPCLSEEEQSQVEQSDQRKRRAIAGGGER